MKYYMYLFLAIIFELFGTSFLLSTEGFTQLGPTLLVAVGIALSFYFLSKAFEKIPVGIAYAIWSGMGIVFLAIIGAFVFDQIPDMPAIIGIICIVSGVMIINLFSKTTSH